MLDRTLALAASAMLFSGPAFGATLQSATFTDIAIGSANYSDGLSVAQFDPSLGTLERVDWEVRSGFITTQGVFNELFEPFPFFPSVTVVYLYSGGFPMRCRRPSGTCPTRPTPSSSPPGRPCR